MFDFVAWFAQGCDTPTSEWQRRAERYLRERTPADWEQHSWSGTGWGIVIRHVLMPRWRWSFAERGAGTHVVAAGFPLGLGATTPVALGERLLAGEDVHAEVTVPFGLLVVDETSGRFAVQQDWHGMAQLFRYESPAGVAFSNRPSSLPIVLGEPVLPHLEGWTYYLGTDAFADSSSPVRGVRQLHPGERLVGQRQGHGWRVASEARRNLDDIAAEAVATPASLEEIVDSVHAGIARSVRDIAHYWSHGLRMGLSGGKDSRLLAAVVLDQGHTPSFRTNEENPLEGEVARALAQALRTQRGLDFDHDFYVATESDVVLEHGLRERARALQWRNDYMFRANYLKRPPEPPQPSVLEAPAMTGIFGEYVSGYWIPRHRVDADSLTHDRARKTLGRRLSTGAPWAALRPRPQDRLEGMVDALVTRARELKLTPSATISYSYMLGRIRRVTTALTHPEQTMPMGVPELVRASIQLPHGDAVGERVHTTLIERLVPEWAGVPFAKARAQVDPTFQRLRIWHGTGQQELEEMLSGDPGAISRMFKRKAVVEALRLARHGEAGGPEDRLLRQFTMAVVAEQSMDDPGTTTRR